MAVLIDSDDEVEWSDACLSRTKKFRQPLRLKIAYTHLDSTDQTKSKLFQPNARWR